MLNEGEGGNLLHFWQGETLSSPISMAFECHGSTESRPARFEKITLTGCDWVRLVAKMQSFLVGIGRNHPELLPTFARPPIVFGWLSRHRHSHLAFSLHLALHFPDPL
jgi:hypothetical protein